MILISCQIDHRNQHHQSSIVSKHRHRTHLGITVPTPRWAPWVRIGAKSPTVICNWRLQPNLKAVPTTSIPRRSALIRCHVFPTIPPINISKFENYQVPQPQSKGNYYQSAHKPHYWPCLMRSRSRTLVENLIQHYARSSSLSSSKSSHNSLRTPPEPFYLPVPDRTIASLSFLLSIPKIFESVAGPI